MQISYPWHKPSTGPTPPVLWVCTGCGSAFWAIDIKDRRFDRRYSCSSSTCPRAGDRSAVRPATPAETTEAERHVKIGGEHVVTSDKPRMRRSSGLYRTVKRKKREAKAARKAGKS